MKPSILKAVEMAFSKHEGQCRKGTKFPYVVHPLAVMTSLLMEQPDHSYVTDDVVIAGLLHDIYEDTNTGLDEIEEAFGSEVRRLVENASEPEELKKSQDKRGTWKERKLHTIERLRELDKASKIISCCDKRNNARSMNEDYLFVGEKLWDRFNACKEDVQWYYKSCLEAYIMGQSIENTRVFVLFQKEVELLCSH